MYTQKYHTQLAGLQQRENKGQEVQSMSLIAVQNCQCGYMASVDIEQFTV